MTGQINRASSPTPGGASFRARRVIPSLSRAGFLLAMRRIWRQGEHLAVIGPTGSGKTTLASALAPLRGWSVVLSVKPRDATMDLFERAGYRIIHDWPPQRDQRRVILWEKPTRMADVAAQRMKIYQALDEIYVAGGWSVVFDDVGYLVENLKLRETIITFLNMGRANGVTAITCAGRPRKATIEVFSQARFVLAFRLGDAQDAARVAEIAGVDRRVYLEVNSRLGRHDFACCFDGHILIVRA